jgi:plastocyanin
MFCFTLGFAYEEIAVVNGGSIVGQVKFMGVPPRMEEKEISKDQEICGKSIKTDESILVGKEHGLQNVVVSLVNIQKGKPLMETTVPLDQRECQYQPHIVFIPIGKPLSILNNDGILHSVRTQSEKNPPFHKAQSKFKKEMQETFVYPEIVKVTCDVHGWMEGWIVIQDHPYFTQTDTSGKFLLSDIPPGTYRLRLWHEVLGIREESVLVRPSKSISLELKF